MVIEMNNVVITIARQYGSGGRTIGEMLAKKLNVHYYDKELMKLASDDSGINEALFVNADEKVKSTKLFHIAKKEYHGELIPPESDDFTSTDNLFNYQAKIIRDLAKEESCIFAGRCADYVLEQDHVENLIRIFVYADMDTRIQRAMDVAKIDEKEAVRRIKRIDKERKEYYRYYTGKDWMNMNNYDLPINASKIDLEQMAVLIKNYLKLKGLL